MEEAFAGKRGAAEFAEEASVDKSDATELVEALNIGATELVEALDIRATEFVEALDIGEEAPTTGDIIYDDAKSEADILPFIYSQHF